MEVKIETLPVMKVAFMRHVGPYDQSGPVWEKLVQWAMQKGFFRPDTLFLGVCYDDPDNTPPEIFRYDACVTVEEGFTGEGDVGVMEVGGRTYATTTHRGPYEKLYDTYTHLYSTWTPEEGWRISTDPCIEIYRNSPENTAPEDLLTDVYVPLERV